MSIDEIQTELNTISCERVTRVGLEPSAIELLFGKYRVYAEASWTYFGINNQKLDSNVKIEERTGFELWKIVGGIVTGVRIESTQPAKLIVLLGDNGYIEFYGDDDDFEDWNLSGPNFNVVCFETASDI